MASKVGSGPPPPAVPVAGPGAAASPSAALPPPSAECCMCGDHGLARELFRCRSCHFRYQHKYCSDLYPKAETYRACNWCLREDGGPAAATGKPSAAKHHHHSTAHLSPSSTSSGKDHHHAPAPPASDNRASSHPLSSTATADNSSSGSKQLQRGGDYAAHLLAKPLKKLRPAALERSASEVIVRVRAAEEMGAPTPRRHAAGGGGPGRGKIRRYKLLEEVSS